MSVLKIVDFGERMFLLLLMSNFLYTFYFSVKNQPYLIAIAISETLAVIFILIRRPGDIAAKPYPLAIAFLGTSLPLFARPGGDSIVPSEIYITLMFGGLLINILAKLFLNRSFGLIAANRGVKSGGPYRIVRHPMYLGYFLNQLGFLLSSFQLWILALYIVAWGIQILRIRAEEDFLMKDQHYRQFAEKVRWRILPGF